MKLTVTIAYSGSSEIEVEAESRDEAEQKAYESITNEQIVDDVIMDTARVWRTNTDWEELEE